jgi:hypothetical protein
MFLSSVPKPVLAVLAVVAGLLAWFVVATLANLVLRAALPGYAAVEKAMNFTLGMLVARLLVGALASVAAGAAAAALARHAPAARYALALVLVLFFIPVHINLWDRFPLWYHLAFLASLAPLALAGARLPR